MHRFLSPVRNISFAVTFPALIILCVALVSAVELLAPPPPWIAPSRYAKKKNPVEFNDASVAAGKKVYEAQCIACHGKKGHGDGIRSAELNPRPRNLAIPEMWLETDGDIYYKIGKGRTPMPSFKKIISFQQNWQVINYLRTLSPKPSVLGYRFDIGQEYRDAIGKVISAATRVSAEMASGDDQALSAALNDLAQAADSLSSVTITSQDKYIVRAWKGIVSGLPSKAHALQSATDESSRYAALTKFSTALNSALRLFGGVETGLLYQFEVSAPDQSGAKLTWFQSESTPKSPFHSEGSSKPSIVSVFGPHTSIDK